MTTLNANFHLLDNKMSKTSSSESMLNKSDSAAYIAGIASLADAVIGEQWLVSNIVPPQGAPEWAMQLEDIGFITGEPVTLMARGAFGGDPLVVRVGASTFALRRAEAACVQLKPMPSVVSATSVSATSVSATSVSTTSVSASSVSASV